MRDDAYLVLALSALRSDIGMLKVAATAIKHGDYADARWFLNHADSSRWIRCLLRRDLSPYNRYPPSLT
jgi:hypothetical protein